MQGLTNWLEQRLVPVAARIGNQRHLSTVRDGLLVAMPFIVIGSLLLAFVNLPFEGLQAALGDFRGELVELAVAVFFTFSLFISLGIGYYLATSYGLHGISGAAIGMAALLGTIVYPMDIWPSAIPLNFIDGSAIFIAIVVPMLAVEVYRWFVKRNIVIKMPAGVPPAATRSFEALLPAAAVIALVFILKYVVKVASGGEHTLISIVNTFLGAPLKLIADNVFGTILAVLLIHLFWTFGLHGANIVGAVMGPVWLALSTANMDAYNAGQVPPHTMTQGTLDFFVYMGGSGATLGLVLLMLFFAKSKQLKQVGRTSIGAGLFNINEPVIFGMPIVLNPIMMIPFILTPIVLVLVSWGLIGLGIIPKVVAVAPWTSPVGMGGWLATGGKMMGLVGQLIMLAVSVVCYYPFFRAYDKQKAKEESEAETKAAA